MNTGKTLFAQLMDFLPWTTFGNYIAKCRRLRLAATSKVVPEAGASLVFRCLNPISTRIRCCGIVCQPLDLG